MDANDVLALGLGISSPWRLVGQRLDTDKRPKELHIELATERGALFPCPDCARPCKAHDFAEFRRIKREGVELCATGREGDAAALLVTALHMIGVAIADSTSPSMLAERNCGELVEIFDAEARGSAKTRNVPNVAQARRIRREGDALCKSGQQAEANAVLLAALRLIGTSDMPTDLQTVITDSDCNGLLERLDKELRGGSRARNVPNAAQARQLHSLARAHCKEGNQEQANEVLVEAFRMIGRSVAL